MHRTGLGHDRHPFGPGEPLRLGGIEIAGAPRLHGHSDGDVVLHAIADALLGATGLGDLGRLAPADARTPRGIASRDLLALALERVRVAGWSPGSVDVTITGARPRLAGHLDAMRDAVGSALALTPDRVSIKASSGNLQGPEGEGRAIAAEAIATLVPAP
ncbi:MAG: 2-C-methyl-D-erythritol 2,4-cyclodiphosphate synthase [Chloroflexi bacterium]|nr:2-C-methyl-D-erythritol 2,4-cyclodiphosphate synthase [Chloroflexota bacterium]